MKCPRCNGSTIVLVNRQGTICPRCKGAGEVPEPSAPAPRHFPIAIVGEAWGAEEAQIGLPFVGASGRELNRILEEADIDRRDCFVTNVFNLQPQPTNDIKNLCTDKKSSTVPMPELSKGAYLQDRYWPEVQRLYDELRAQRPNLIIALGNTALWALTGTYGIRALRGTVTAATHGGEGVVGRKILPTYHPAAVLRDWSIRPVVVADLMKAKRQASFPDIRRPRRELWIEPSLNHIELFYNQYVLSGCRKLSADIETAGATQITCVGFAPSPERAIVVPFVDNRKDNGSFWASSAEEKAAWIWVRRFMQHIENPQIEIVGQNALYDWNWLWTKLGFTPRNFVRDTMLKHHAINPELEKGLGFLGSIYTDEPAWKTMRGKGLFTIKRGE